MATTLKQTEQFAVWHNDIKVENDNLTATNDYAWTHHRTCYGDVSIPSMSDIVVTWTIHIVKLDPTVGYCCIGIASDECKHTDTWFYDNKDSANYGYECTGNIYAWGETKGLYDKKEVIERYNREFQSHMQT